MKRALLTICILTIIFSFACGRSKVVHYEESRITSMAWAGDTLIAYSRIQETGFIAGGIRRNAKFSVELWIAKVDPVLGKLDTNYRLREISAPFGKIEFFPGGEDLLYAAKDGVWKVNLRTTESKTFFTHPAFRDYPVEINVGPGEDYVAIVVDAEGFPGTEELLDLFMVETKTGNLVFHTDSLRDARSFAWNSHDCVSYIVPDPWNEGAFNIMQFGVSDCLILPSEMTEEEVLCNCPQANLSRSGMWVAVDNNGKLKIEYNG